MKRAFSIEVNSIHDFSVTGAGGRFLNSNTYIKLLNSNMDPDTIAKQAASAGPEGHPISDIRRTLSHHVSFKAMPKTSKSVAFAD